MTRPYLLVPVEEVVGGVALAVVDNDRAMILVVESQYLVPRVRLHWVRWTTHCMQAALVRHEQADV